MPKKYLRSRAVKIIALFFSVITAAFLLVGGYLFYSPTIAEPDLPGRFTQHELRIHERLRTYSLYTPALPAADPAVIFVLHGSKGSGAAVRGQSAYEFDQLADQHGYLLVYPDGFENHWNDCRGSANYTANTQNIDDVGFLTALLDSLAGQYGVDRTKVFATGFSNGGHMALRLALEAPELVAGVAPIAANLPVDENLDCEPTEQPVSVAILNGTEDPINPYAGGLVELFGDSSRGHVRSSLASTDYWLGLAAIDQSPRTIVHPERDGNPSSSVVEQRWLGASGVEVRLYTLQGSGHVIASPVARFPRILGGQAGDISAAQEIVDFFLNLEAS